MKHTQTKLALAMLVATSGAAFAGGEVNFSNLSAGTVTNLTISQTGTAGFNRIGGGSALTATHTATTPSVALGATAARAVTFAEAASDTSAFTHTGTLTTLSLTQVSPTANGTSDDNENSISGALYTSGGSVTVNQNGEANAVDMRIGTSSSSLATTTSITQTGNDNSTMLTRTAGSNTDTLTSTGNLNTLYVTGAATGTNSVKLTLAGNSNSAWISQAGSDATIRGYNGVETAIITGDSNVLDLNQSGATTLLGLTVAGNTNRIYTTQSGAATTGNIYVNGATNNVDLNQAGTSATATLSLTGAGNDVNITQATAATSATTALTLTGATGATVGVTQNTANASYTYTGTVPSGGSITVTQ